MKNLANCTPREFLMQSNKIRKIAADWLDATKVMEIRKTKPAFPKDATAEETKAIIVNQSKANLMKMLDAALEDNVDKTLELLGALCFVEPEHVDDYKITEYLANIGEIIGNQEVLSFFTSLVQLGNRLG